MGWVPHEWEPGRNKIALAHLVISPDLDAKLAVRGAKYSVFRKGQF